MGIQNYLMNVGGNVGKIAALGFLFLSTGIACFGLSDEAKKRIEELRNKETFATSTSMIYGKKLEGKLLGGKIEADNRTEGIPQKFIDEAFNRAIGNLSVLNISDFDLFCKYPGIIYAKTKSGDNLLHVASSHRNLSWISRLVQNRELFEMRNNDNLTPIEACKDADVKAILENYLEKASNVSTVANNVATGPVSLKVVKKEPEITSKVSSAKTTYIAPTRDNNSPGCYSVYRGPRGGVYHYSKSGKKVYHSRKR